MLQQINKHRRWARGLGCAVWMAMVVVEGAAQRGSEWLDQAALEQALRPGGAPKLVHIWSSWCMPCRAELPALVEVLRSQDFRKFDVLVVALESEKSAREAARLWQHAGGVRGRVRYATAEDAFPAVQMLDPNWDGAIPATYVVDPSGRVVLSQVGTTDLAALVKVAARLVRTHKPQDGPSKPAGQRDETRRQP